MAGEFPGRPPVRLPVYAVDDRDSRYRLSRPPADDRLRDSIGRRGILRPPVILGGEGTFIPVFGHNRIAALRELGSEFLDAFVVTAVDPEWFVPAALEKNYHQEIGPVGRLRLVRIMREELRIEAALVADMARAELGIPGFFLGDGAAAAVLSLPSVVREYLDHRNIGYKTIREIVGLDQSLVGLVERWLARADIRVNIFRELVEMLADLSPLNVSPADFPDEFDDSLDRRSRERVIHDAVYRRRYPEYRAFCDRLEAAVRELKAPGIEVVPPAFGEGRGIELRFRLGRDDGIGTLRERIEAIDSSALERLLRLR